MESPSDTVKQQLDVTGRSVADIAIAVLILAGVTLLQGLLALHWFSWQVFDQFNVIFDSDPNTWLRYGSSTTPDAGTAKHPLAAYYTGVPVLMLAKLIGLVVDIQDPAALRVLLALWVAPLVCGLKNMVVYLALRQYAMPVRDALLMTGLCMVSFSSVVFGAVPETYGYTGLFVAVSYWLVLRRGRGMFFLLSANAVLLIGTSAANALSVFCVFCARAWTAQGRILSAGLYAAVFSVLVYGVAVGAFWSGAKIRGLDLTVAQVLMPAPDVRDHAPSVEGQWINMVRFPERLARSIIATVPDKKQNILLQDGDVYPFELSYNTKPFDVWASALWMSGIVILGAGALCLRHATPLWRAVLLMSGGQIAVYAALFSFYGYNTFLYSQHWQVCVIFMMAAILATMAGWTPWVRRGMQLGLAGLILSLMLTLYKINMILAEACGVACL